MGWSHCPFSLAFDSIGTATLQGVHSFTSCRYLGRISAPLRISRKAQGLRPSCMIDFLGFTFRTSASPLLFVLRFRHWLVHGSLEHLSEIAGLRRSSFFDRCVTAMPLSVFAFHCLAAFCAFGVENSATACLMIVLFSATRHKNGIGGSLHCVMVFFLKDLRGCLFGCGCQLSALRFLGQPTAGQWTWYRPAVTAANVGRYQHLAVAADRTSARAPNNLSHVHWSLRLYSPLAVSVFRRSRVVINGIGSTTGLVCFL